jgi:thiol-disulfide isomerase/thioredoxin
LINLPQLFLRRVAALASATVMGAFLYAAGLSGKEGVARAANATACAGSTKISAAVAPLAKGDVAALSISKKPEPLESYAFQDSEGKPVSLATFRGRTVLLNLWATWCVPCRGEMTELDRLQTALGSDKFEVVAINVDTSRPERPKALFEELGLKSLRRYADPKANIFFEMKQAGKALGLPLTLLIDPEGCQIGLINGPAAWGSADARALVTRAVEAAAP